MGKSALEFRMVGCHFSPGANFQLELAYSTNSLTVPRLSH